MHNQYLCDQLGKGNNFRPTNLLGKLIDVLAININCFAVLAFKSQWQIRLGFCDRRDISHGPSILSITLQTNSVKLITFHIYAFILRGIKPARFHSRFYNF